MVHVFPPPHLAEQGKALADQNPDTSGLVFATSGTSGDPKWILHSQEGLDWCARTVNDYFNCTSRDVWGLALPQYHVGGYCLTQRAHLAKGRLAQFDKKWNPELFQHWLQKEKVTLTSLVPTQVFDLVAANLTAPSHLRLALIGGEHLEEPTFERALKLGWPLVTSYGMTETAGLIAASQVGKRNLQILPGWKATADSEDLLTIDGPGLFKGHLLTSGFQEVPRPFVTSDLVEIENKSLTIKGRIDDQIKILGELVDLAELRKVFATIIPANHSTIIALPDQRRGFLLQPVIEENPDPKIEEATLTWNTSLPAFSRCQPPCFLKDWPRTPIGKVDHRALTAQITAKVANEQNCLLPHINKLP